MKIGWIGLGQIGLPMVLALLKGGYQVKAHSRRPHDHQVIIEAGGSLVKSPRDFLQDVEAIGINAFSETQLDDIFNAQGGILNDIPPGTKVFIHSTISPMFVKKLASVRSDIHWLDCAFSGTADDVIKKNITLMVGGDSVILDELRPALSCYCNHINHIGEVGAGLVVKILNNALFAANIQLALDALQITVDNNLDINLVGKVLAQSSGASYALNILLSGDDPFAIAEQLRHYLDKDVEVARNAAAASNINLKRIADMTTEYGSK